MAVDGVNEILRSMAEVEQGEDNPHKFEGYSILPTFFDRTTKETATQLRDLVDAFGKKVWPPIPQDTKAREAAAFGKTLWEYCLFTVNQGINSTEKGGGYLDLLDRFRGDSMTELKRQYYRPRRPGYHDQTRRKGRVEVGPGEEVEGKEEGGKPASWSGES